LRSAPLLPKLRGYFAEFLNNTSPVGLRILSSSTCVGLRYGYSVHNSGFSRQTLRQLRYFTSLLSAPRLIIRIYLYDGPSRPSGLSFPRTCPCICVPTVLIRCSAGISTCCPSATTLVLTLGPDCPRADQLYPGNLGYSALKILTSISLLIPAFSLPDCPLPLSVQLRPVSNAPLPIILSYDPQASVSCFSPAHFRRGTSRPVSYYALF
jgi:hypothetical protein